MPQNNAAPSASLTVSGAVQEVHE